MKKWLIVLCILPVLLFSGCGGQKSPQVGICLRQCDDSAAAERLEDMRLALTGAGYAVAAADAQEDQARQNRQIAELIENGYDLLVVEPVMTEQALAIAELAEEGDVPIIFIGHEPPREALEYWEKVCYVGSEEDLQGSVQATLLRSLADGGDLNGDGTVCYAVIAGPEAHIDAAAATQGVKEAVENGTCLEVVYTDWTREAGKQTCANLLSRYGKDMEVVFCNSDTLAWGAMDAIAEGGRVTGQTIYLMGIGGDIQTRLLVRSGDITGTVYLPTAAQADAILAAARALLEDKPVESRQYGQYVALTKENIEQYL